MSNKDILGNGSNFLIGANIPWRSYGYDYADGIYDNDWWCGYKDDEKDGQVAGFRRLKDVGGNVARMWLFGEGSSLQWNWDGSPSLSRNEINNFKAMLDAADKYQIKVIPSFVDFLIGSWSTERVSIITSWNQCTGFINNVVVPLVNACRGDRRVLAWEVINEPEQLFPQENNSSWLRVVPMWQVQRFVARVAAAIHKTDPGALVTVGGNNLKYQYNKRGDDPYDFRQCIWEDNELAEAAQGDPDVYYGQTFVDVLQVHFYGEWRYDFCQDPFYDGNKPWNAPGSTSGSKYNYLPVRGDDPGFCGKPVILAEVQANIGGDDKYSANALADRAVAQGYSGLLFWSAFSGHTSSNYNGDGKGNWWDMKQAINNHGGWKISRNN